MATILVIDDDADVRAGIRRILERAGHLVVEAEDGRAAMDLSHDPPDLVITDINMPEMDGIEVILSLAEDEEEIPIIAVSGGGKLPKELLLSSADALGAVRSLAKPFEMTDLVAAVDAALAGSTSGGDSTPG